MGEFPKKTVAAGAGVGLLVFLFWHGRSWGFGRGKSVGYTELGLMPASLRKFLQTSPQGDRPADTVELITVQRGNTYTGILDQNNLVLGKSGNNDALTVSDLLSMSNWFKSGKLKLVIRISGDALSGNVSLLAKTLVNAGIPAQIMTGRSNQSGSTIWTSYDVISFYNTHEQLLQNRL